jgi:Proteasome subunit
MTSIVGILCKNGVVIATDSSATFANGQIRTIEQPTEKIKIIGDTIIVVGTGEVGLGQRFCDIVKTGWGEKLFTNPPIDVGRQLSARFVRDCIETGAQRGTIGVLIAFPAEHTPNLCELGVSDLQPELKTEDLWFVSMGSAQHITDTFLGFIREVFWENGMPNLHDGIFAATWALDYAVNVNPGGVNGPVRVAVLETLEKAHFSARILDENELDEHRQNIKEAKQSLRDYKSRHQTSNISTIPPVP